MTGTASSSDVSATWSASMPAPSRPVRQRRRAGRSCRAVHRLLPERTGTAPGAPGTAEDTGSEVKVQEEKATHMSRGTPESEPLLTPAEVATMFRVDPKTVTRWAKAGKLTSVRTLGGHRRYRETEVRELLAGTAAPPGFAHAVRPLPDPPSSDITPDSGEPAARDSWMAEALRQGASIDAIAEAARIPAAQVRRRLRGAGALP
jgi:excisionase family DNA binding protein